MPELVLLLLGVHKTADPAWWGRGRRVSGGGEGGGLVVGGGEEG